MPNIFSRFRGCPLKLSTPSKLSGEAIRQAAAEASAQHVYQDSIPWHVHFARVIERYLTEGAK